MLRTIITNPMNNPPSFPVSQLPLRNPHSRKFTLLPLEGGCLKLLTGIGSALQNKRVVQHKEMPRPLVLTPPASVSTQTPDWQTGVNSGTQTTVAPLCRTQDTATQTDAHFVHAADSQLTVQAASTSQ